MQKDRIQKLRMLFEESAQNADGIEFWYARDLQKLLDYDEWRNFFSVIDKAKITCITSGQKPADHFVDANKMIALGKSANREVDDIMLTRYACYLTAQNGDPRKDQIAFAQSYFAIQTRKQELIEQRIAVIERINARKKLVEAETELSKLIFERGVDEYGFARIRSKGDEALFGGYKTAQMKDKLSIPQYRALADFLPTITITAKNLATEITNFNVQADNLAGEPTITGEHIKNNKDVRRLLGKSGIEPEHLPAEEDLKKMQKRINEEEKKIAAR
ncbi:MAG TPA: DNA damage-inducible protein D [Candidatus Nanoarchaeia archaeon]|nr:DNA damage-inducible protein D [Candidatus Nanoarchaeia archaeon]